MATTTGAPARVPYDIDGEAVDVTDRPDGEPLPSYAPGQSAVKTRSIEIPANPRADSSSA